MPVAAKRKKAVAPKAAPVASVDEIRAAFPAMRRKHKGQPVAYLDGPGGTQVPQTVADAVNDYLLHHNANTHWRYPTSEESDEIIADARQTLADFVNGRPDEIAFGQNMTTLTFHLARGIGRELGRGDEVVVTELDHHGNIAPWRALEAERGVTVRTVRLKTEDGRLDRSDLQDAIGPRTKVVAIGAASNALGTITDVKRAAQLAHAAGALVFVDAVHFAPHVLVDVQDIGCDFLAMSAYKFYGPHIGVMWGRRELIDHLDVPRLDPAPQESPERLETGTQNHEGIAGTARAVDFLASLARGKRDARGRRGQLVRAFDELHRRGQALFQRLWSGLEGVRGLSLHGPDPDGPRTPTLSFTLKGKTAEQVAVALAARGLFVSHGDFYAATVLERFGHERDGFVRVGCSCYTTAKEIDRVIEGVRAIARG